MHTRAALVFWPSGITPDPLASNRHSTGDNQSKKGEATAAQQQQQQQQHDSQQPLRNFLVGWNVRDFTVVVAAVVTAASAQDVQAAVAEMHSRVQSLCFSEVEQSSAPVLTIVGICTQPQHREQQQQTGTTSTGSGSPTTATSTSTGGTATATTSTSTAAATDRALQELRASTNAFIELECSFDSHALPTMRSLYTSGIKFDAALHVLTYDAHLFDKRRVPLPYSPLVRLEKSDVESILAGKTASRVLRGGKSVLEGPFLPPHTMNLMPPLHPRHLAPRSTVVGNNSSNTPNSSFSSVPATAATAAPLSPSLRAVASSSSASALMLSPIHERAEEAVEVDAKSLDATVPPRLIFPTANSLTDFGCCKSCLSGAQYVRHRLQSGDADLYPSSSGSFRKMILSGFEEVLVVLASLLSPLAALLLGPVSYLATFSYTGCIFEYKLRELINGLALICGKTTTCGLHPVLPHTLCGMRGERRTCLLAFAARQIVGDIFLGFGLFWLLMLSSSFWEQSISATSSFWKASSTSALYQAANCTNATVASSVSANASASAPRPPLCGATAASDSVFDFMRSFTWYGLHGLHVGYFDWFHGYPGGLKLNADLNEVLSLLCFKTMELFAFVSSFIYNYVDVYKACYRILLFSSLGGASIALSWAADCCNIATLHIRSLYHVVAFLYHGLTTVTGSLLLIMRGKKKNPRKSRVDDATFEFDEVVLGTLACTACAFLVPTVALYYFYLAIQRTVIWVLQESIRGFAVLCCNAPIYPAFLWLSRRKQWVLTGGVVLTNTRSGSGSNRSSHTSASEEVGDDDDDDDDSFVADIVFLPLPFSTVFRELGLLAGLLFSGAFSLSRIARFIWTADSGSKPTVDVPNIVMRHLKKDPARPALVV